MNGVSTKRPRKGYRYISLKRKGIQRICVKMATLEKLAASMDTFYLLVCGVLVFFMQAGFGMLEAGSVRQKNIKNILLKNLLDACIAGGIWWAWGMGVANAGKDAFIGLAQGEKGDSRYFFLMGEGGAGEHPSGYENIFWFFQFVFAATAATIVSGAVAERCQLGAYLVYTFFLTAFVYPVVVHWCWSGAGWLSAFNADHDATFVGGCIDFAGSGVVHMTGGITAFWAALFLGARRGRYSSDGKLIEMPGHSSVLVVLGTFILWVGWYGFNPGSTLLISTDLAAQTAARAAVNTTLSAAAGGLIVIVLEKLIGSKCWDVAAICNGVLAGLVSITAGCATCVPWVGFMTGLFGGLVYFGTSKLMKYKLKIDDPLDAFAVHGACGIWGVFSVGFTADPDYTSDYYGWTNATAWTPDYAGAFYGGDKLLLAQFVAILAQLAWVSFFAIIVFGGLRLLGLLRISAEVEEAGMDASKHGGAAYETPLSHAETTALRKWLTEQKLVSSTV